VRSYNTQIASRNLARTFFRLFKRTEQALYALKMAGGKRIFHVSQNKLESKELSRAIKHVMSQKQARGEISDRKLSASNENCWEYRKLFGSEKEMDKLEEIGRRLNEELTRLRRYVDEEVAPETERRTAQFLREVSETLTTAASRLESRNAARAAKSGKETK